MPLTSVWSASSGMLKVKAVPSSVSMVTVPSADSVIVPVITCSSAVEVSSVVSLSASSEEVSSSEDASPVVVSSVASVSVFSS